MLNELLFRRELEAIVSTMFVLKSDKPTDANSGIELLKQYIRVSLGIQDKGEIVASIQALKTTQPTLEQITKFYAEIASLETKDFSTVAAIWEEKKEILGQIDAGLAEVIDASIKQFRESQSPSVPSVPVAPVTTAETGAAAMEDVPVIVGEVSVRVPNKTWEIKQLEQLFEELGAKHGGVIEITEGARPKTLNVSVKGSASFVYSVYSPFFNAENYLQESSIDEQRVGKFTIILEGLRQKLQERNALKFVQDYLSIQGFEVEAGGKPSPRVFPEADEFKRQDPVAFKQRFGVSLNLANQLHTEASLQVSMPFAFAAETGDKTLRDDLNFCFKELKLIAANGQPKECIDLKNGRFLANIGSSQAIDLEKHFQQRAMLWVNTDDAMKRSIKEAGGPLRAVEMIRAQLMSYIERVVPREPDAAAQLLRVTCSSHPARLVSGYNACGQEEFVKRLEKVINDNFIIGPSSFDFFLSSELLSMGSEASFQALGRLLSSQALDDASNPVAKDVGIIPHKAEYLRQYPMKDANHNIAYQFRALDPRRSEHERQAIVDASGAVGERLEQMRQFRVQHSPFYVVQQISDKLRCLLQGAKEDKITEILTVLGLTEEQMSTYRIVGPHLSRYNVYHIEFMLPVMVLNFCMNNAILLRPQCALQANLQGYLHDPHNKVTATNSEAAWRALEWSYNEKFKCGWLEGASKRYDYQTGFGRFFGGSTHTGMGTDNTPPVVKKTTTTSTYSSS